MNTELKQTILYHLKHGKENAIKKTDLLRLCGLSNSETDDRYLRLTIEELRKEKHAIGISFSRPMGYYIIDNADELESNMSTFRGYCISAATTRRDLKLARPDLFREIKEREFARLHPGQLSFKELISR